MGPDAMSARLIFRSPTRCRRGNQATIIGCDRRQRGGTDESQAAVRAPPLPPSASSPFLQAQSSISDPPDMLFSPPTVSVEGSTYALRECTPGQHAPQKWLHLARHSRANS